MKVFKIDFIYRNLRQIENTQMKFERKLGRGNNSDVNLFVETETGKKTVVKTVYFPENCDNMGERAKKIDCYKQLSNERVVKYYRYLLDEKCNALHIYLEYVPCGSLLAYIQSNKKKKLGEHEIQKYTKQILDGLNYLHTQSPPIIHKCIKAANILMDESNNIKLTDIGSSSLISSIHNESTTIGMNTFYWMAPEQVDSDTSSTQTDIWSVGCTVVEMFTTHPPWHPMNVGQMIKALLRGDYPAYSLPKCSPDARAFLNYCFQNNPNTRPTTSQLLETVFCTMYVINLFMFRFTQNL